MMRWIRLGILVYLVVLAQTTLAGVLTFRRVPLVGPVGPDLVAILAVYVAVYAPSGADAMLAAWLMGLAVDLTTGAGVEVSTAIGPMAFSYALAAGAVYRLRDLVFRDSAVTQCILAAVFCLLAHGLWVTAQWLLALRWAPWSGYLVMLVQAVLLAGYTAVLMPVAGLGLRWCHRWMIFRAPPGRRRRRRL